MLRIFVADDELLVIEGIRILIDAVNVECEIIGTANNGTEAWSRLCGGDMEIDLLLTDIRMPGMSGLELLENCKELYPEMMTAVISGYREFRNVRERIGLIYGDAYGVEISSETGKGTTVVIQIPYKEKSFYEKNIM